MPTTTTEEIPVSFIPSSFNVENIVGEIVTVSSIVPSGLFAALLTDLLLKSLDVEINYRIALDIVFFIATVEPKRRLMRAYNTGTFNSIFQLKYQDLLAAENFTPSSIINGFSSLLGGLTFGGLAYLSLLQLAELMRSYETHTGDAMALGAKSAYTMSYFIVTSFIANALSFPAMQRASLGLLHNALSEFLLTNHEQQVCFEDQALLSQATYNLMTAFKNLVTQLRLPNNDTAIQSSYLSIRDALSTMYPISFPSDVTVSSEDDIRQLLAFANGFEDDAALIKRLVTPDEGNSPTLRYPVAVSMTARAISFGMAAVCIAGLSNFYAIALELFSIIEPVVVAPLLATMVMISMSLLAFISVYAYGALVANNLEPAFNKIYPEILTGCQRGTLLLGNSVMCAMGSLPNTYQALVLVGQSPPLVACAFIASFSLEVKASYDVTRAKKEAVAIDKLAVQQPLVKELFNHLKRLDALAIQKPTKGLTRLYSSCCQSNLRSDSHAVRLLDPDTIDLITASNREKVSST